MVDPDTNDSGKGIACLRAAGIEVSGPVERARCEWINRGFISLRTNGRPWVTLKRAQTMAGAVAQPDGSSLKITAAEQDRWAHEWLRARHDVILVGVQTIITDDPQLNTRIVHGLPSPLRVILDPKLRIPLTARVVKGALASGTVVVTAPGVDRAERKVLTERGVRVVEIPLHDGHFDLPSIWKVLTRPTIQSYGRAAPDGDFHGIVSILIEGGARTWQRFREANVIDEEVTLIGRTQWREHRKDRH
ncbi:MAG: dihydrofolate reductase family protein [Candidatus Peregrinibacteria bacterium]